MSETDEPRETPPVPVVPILNYADSTVHPEMVTVARYSDLAEAELLAGELDAEGIRAIVTNTLASAMGPWGGGARVYVDVPKNQIEAAAQVMHVRALGDEVEPAPDAPDESPGDETLVVVAAYDTASRMRDAVTLLGSARINCFTPRLVARGDRPKGEGDRFTVRVRQDDAQRARKVLEQADDDDDEDDDDGEDREQRCPKCASWRVHRDSSMWVDIGRFFGLAGGSEATDPLLCLACGHRWEPDEGR